MQDFILNHYLLYETWQIELVKKCENIFIEKLG